ncbi:cucumisin-like [Hordeum vulgare]|nr:cucumisin-like [Hordeum vulgare]
MAGAAAIKAAIAAVFLVTCLHASDHISGNGDGGDERQVYIVYMGHPPAAGEKTAGGFSVGHHELLSRALHLDHSSAYERIVYSYQRTLNGFAARLTKDDKEKLSSTLTKSL